MNTTSKRRKSTKRPAQRTCSVPKRPPYRNDAEMLLRVRTPERLHAWLDLLPQSQRDWFECMRLVWTTSENLYLNKSCWLSFLNHPNVEKDKWLMEKQELTFLRSLPDTFTVYRGCPVNKVNGLSWTLDRDKALWFANRFNFASRMPPFDRECCVVTGTVKKTDVFAYFNSRHESEIVVAPSNVKNKTTEVIPPTR